MITGYRLMDETSHSRFTSIICKRSRLGRRGKADVEVSAAGGLAVIIDIRRSGRSVRTHARGFEESNP